MTRATNQSVADLIGVDQSYVSLIRHGQRMPSRQLLKRMIETLGMNSAEALTAFLAGQEEFSAYFKRTVFCDVESPDVS